MGWILCLWLGMHIVGVVCGCGRVRGVIKVEINFEIEDVTGFEGVEVIIKRSAGRFWSCRLEEVLGVGVVAISAAAVPLGLTTPGTGGGGGGITRFLRRFFGEKVPIWEGNGFAVIVTVTRGRVVWAGGGGVVRVGVWIRSLIRCGMGFGWMWYGLKSRTSFGRWIR